MSTQIEALEKGHRFPEVSFVLDEGTVSRYTAAVEDEARLTWNCWARQTGKSFTFSLRRVLRGLQRRRNQIILSAGERQRREVISITLGDLT